jgi:hypothetical protein
MCHSRHAHHPEKTSELHAILKKAADCPAPLSGTSLAHPSCMTNAQRILSWFDAYGPDSSIELDLNELKKLDESAEKSAYWNHRDMKKMVDTLKHLRGWNPQSLN